MRWSRLQPRDVLNAYAVGAFPMTDPDGVTRWYTADPRGVLPLHEEPAAPDLNAAPGRFHVPRSLERIIRLGRFEVRIDSAFDEVVRGCGERTAGTWIGRDLREVYGELHRMGFAHSVEAWMPPASPSGSVGPGGAIAELVGGVYGVALGGAFFAESMFHRRSDAGKVAVVALVRRLRQRGYVLLDTQECSATVARFGGTEISARTYRRRLAGAMAVPCTFTDDPPADPPPTLPPGLD